MAEDPRARCWVAKAREEGGTGKQGLNDDKQLLGVGWKASEKE